LVRYGNDLGLNGLIESYARTVRPEGLDSREAIIQDCRDRASLAAKPIIDIDVVVASPATVSVAIERLAVIGYEHQGNLGVEGREAFKNPPGSLRHHLYVCTQGGTAFHNHLSLRDYLRSNPDAAAKYGRLKTQLAIRFPADIDRYIDGKTDFILEVLRTKDLTDDQLRAVSAANRLA